MKKYLISLLQSILVIPACLYAQVDPGKDVQAKMLTVSKIVNPTISSMLRASFKSLFVNPEAVRNVTGIPSFAYEDFDFLNFYKSEKKGEEEIAYSAPYKNRLARDNYSFTIFVKGGMIGPPVLVRANPDRSLLILYDLVEGKTAEILKARENYICASRTVNLGVTTALKKGCGQAVMDCVTDAYTNHGWTSVWVSIQSIFVPATGVAITLGCIVANCK